MSDLGLLSYKYQRIAELSRRLRRNVLLIKRQYYKLPLPEADKETNIDQAIANIQEIVEFLRDVVPLSEEDIWPAKWIDEPPFPITLVEQLRKIHNLDKPQYIKTLTRLEQRLQDTSTLREKDIFLLEEIAYAASADANIVFRKLMRWA